MANKYRILTPLNTKYNKRLKNNNCYSFDGLDDKYSFKCRYDDPNIFPVGWCEITGHSLQSLKHDGNLRVYFLD